MAHSEFFTQASHSNCRFTSVGIHLKVFISHQPTTTGKCTCLTFICIQRAVFKQKVEYKQWNIEIPLQVSQNLSLTEWINCVWRHDLQYALHFTFKKIQFLLNGTFKFKPVSTHQFIFTLSTYLKNHLMFSPYVICIRVYRFIIICFTF